MEVVTIPIRLLQFLFSAPLKAVHWASYKVTSNVKEWSPLELLSRESKYALLILNQPIAFSKDSAVMLWNRGMDMLRFSLLSFNNTPIPMIWQLL